MGCIAIHTGRSDKCDLWLRSIQAGFSKDVSMTNGTRSYAMALLVGVVVGAAVGAAVVLAATGTG
jgi:hypothetical protein